MLENLQVILSGIVLIFFNIAVLVVTYFVIKDFISDINHYFKYRANGEMLLYSFMPALLMLVVILMYILIIIETYKASV